VEVNPELAHYRMNRCNISHQDLVKSLSGDEKDALLIALLRERGSVELTQLLLHREEQQGMALAIQHHNHRVPLPGANVDTAGRCQLSRNMCAASLGLVSHNKMAFMILH